jgi:hypothetical protein
MFTAKPLAIPVASVLLLACSSRGSTGSAGDEALVVPDGLTVRALAGGNGVFRVTALTLQKGSSSSELYAALKNEGDSPACDAALAVELFDRTEQSLAAGIGALFTRHFYRLADGSGTIAACAAPGDVTMAAVTDLPSDLALDEVGYVVYRCPYFALDVVPIAGLIVGQVTSVARDDGTAYTGTLVNELDIAVTSPSVTVFPVNRAGRPLGAATGSGTEAVSPGNSWAFETNPVDAPAADYAAYPAGAFAN